MSYSADALPRSPSRKRNGARQRDHLAHDRRSVAGELAGEDAPEAPADEADASARCVRGAARGGRTSRPSPARGRRSCVRAASRGRRARAAATAAAAAAVEWSDPTNPGGRGPDVRCRGRRTGTAATPRGTCSARAATAARARRDRSDGGRKVGRRRHVHHPSCSSGRRWTDEPHCRQSSSGIVDTAAPAACLLTAMGAPRCGGRAIRGLTRRGPIDRSIRTASGSPHRCPRRRLLLDGRRLGRDPPARRLRRPGHQDRGPHPHRHAPPPADLQGRAGAQLRRGGARRRPEQGWAVQQLLPQQARRHDQPAHAGRARAGGAADRRAATSSRRTSRRA